MSYPRVAFVDDHPMLLEGMGALFRDSGYYEVVATGTRAADALDIVGRLGPDLIFIDLSMPGDVFGAISEIVRCWPGTSIIIFTAFSSVDSAMRALDAGASGFVLKGSVKSELLAAAEAVLGGKLYITPEYASEVMTGLRNKAKRERVAQAIRLNVREQQIVGQLLKAKTNREIADVLRISEKTVKHYMTSLMQKLNARNRLEVVIAAQNQTMSSQEPSPATVD